MDFFNEISSERNKHEVIKTISDIPNNYVGCKRRLLYHIYDVLEDNNIKYNKVFDAFSGSGIVSSLFKLLGKNVVSNDLLTSSSLNALCLCRHFNDINLSTSDLHFLLHNKPSDIIPFVTDNYGKFFTPDECNFLDSYRRNIEILFNGYFNHGYDASDKKLATSFENPLKQYNHQKAMSASFALFLMQNHINQNCFVGGRCYSGQTLARLDHRLAHQKSKGKEIHQIKFKSKDFDSVRLSKDEKLEGTQYSCQYNADIIKLLENGHVKADLLYLDPPYGGANSDYAFLYKFLEEYIYRDKLENLSHLKNSMKRFSNAKNYQSEFEYLLSLCSSFPTWLISYNNSSYAGIETITDTIHRVGKKKTKVIPVQFEYQYRKKNNVSDLEHFKENYANNGHKFEDQGTEYLVLAYE